MFAAAAMRLHAYYATFGTGQTYAGHYVEIHAEDYDAAYECMTRAHGDHWASIYPERQFREEKHISKYDYVKLATVYQQAMRDDGRLVFLARR